MPWYPGKASRGTPIIPYGPGLPFANEAAVLAAFPVGTPVYDMAETVEANKLKRIRQVFRNSGVDYVDCGRIASIVGLRPGVDSFSIVICANSAVNLVGTMFSFGCAADPVKRQLQIYLDNAVPSYNSYFGGSMASASIPSAIDINKWHTYKATASGASVSFTYDNASAGAAVPGTYMGPENIYIGGRTDGVSVNFEGNIAFVSVLDGSGTLIDMWDFNRTDLWNGGSSGYSVKGNPFTVVDGSPTGTAVKACVPINLGG